MSVGTGHVETNTGIAAWSFPHRKILAVPAPVAEMSNVAALGVSEDAMLVTLRLSGAVLRPGSGFKALYGTDHSTYYSVLANVILTY